jgi:hypothetical protein
MIAEVRSPSPAYGWGVGCSGGGRDPGGLAGTAGMTSLWLIQTRSDFSRFTCLMLAALTLQRAAIEYKVSPGRTV